MPISIVALYFPLCYNTRVKKLSPSQILDIVSRYQAGESSPTLAVQFGISPPAVRGLLKRRGVIVRGSRAAQLRYEVNEQYFDVIDSEPKAYWLGFLAADGNVFGTALQVVLSARDKSHLHNLRDSLDSTHPIKLKSYKGFEQVRLFIRSEILTLGLKKHGVVPNKSFTLAFPTFLSDDLLSHYLRGYVDGDGCFSRSGGNVEFSVTSNAAFLREMQRFLMRKCGLKQTTFYYRVPGSIATLRYCGRFQVNRIHDFLYSKSSISLTRKLDF